LAGGFLYVPGFSGSVFKLSRDTGAVLSVLQPFAPDPDTFVAGGLAADSTGNVYYNALKLNPAGPWDLDALGAWLVRVSSDDSTSLASYAAIVPGAPAAKSLCKYQFTTEPLPWPPSPTAVPPSSRCGSQRPGLNAIPAVAPDGTIYTVSTAHLNNRYSYLVAVKPDLTPLWAASLRDILNDGCDVSIPPSGTPGGCREGATRGVDPATNERPAGRISDLSTASPVVLPDGAILIGTTASYNYLRGHLFKFSAAGSPLATYDFGWDTTPAVFAHDGSYSVLLKDNHYDVGSYCGSPRCPNEAGQYNLVSLDANLVPEGTFTNTNTLSCSPQADGATTSDSDHPHSVEWCVNEPAVDAAGVVYANSEDGFLYAIGRDGKLKQKIFLDRAIGAAYTPLSLDSAGRIYAQNFGRIFVVGSSRVVSPPRPAPRPKPVPSR
jgi:outer membrane protein assembly factor BamB